MKKYILFLLSILLLPLSVLSCSSETFTTVWYEDMAHMEKNISFTVKTLPNAGDPIVYGVMDRRLSDLRYSVTDEYGRSASLSFRMSTPDYVKKLDASGKEPFAGEHGLPTKTERLGSAHVSYYSSGSTVSAEWELGSYAYAIILKFDENESAVPDDIRDYVLSVISMGVN